MELLVQNTLHMHRLNLNAHNALDENINILKHDACVRPAVGDGGLSDGSPRLATSLHSFEDIDLVNLRQLLFRLVCTVSLWSARNLLHPVERVLHLLLLDSRFQRCYDPSILG